MGLLLLLLLWTLAFDAYKEKELFNLSISTEGFQRFIDYFSPYKEFLGSTIAVIGIYLVIRQIYARTTANKISNWINWNQKFELQLSSLLEHHKTMQEHFVINGLEMHEYLFNSDMVISNKRQLRKFFNKFIAKGIPEFEQKSREYRYAAEQNQLYGNNTTSYSYLSYFSKISKLIARPNIYYPNITIDLKEMYLDRVQEYKEDANFAVRPQQVSICNRLCGSLTCFSQCLRANFGVGR
jgi:hypothetical protein